MYCVTGGAGFIGSRIVKGLNAAGHRNIIVVDDLTDGRKFHNLVDCDIADYQDIDDFSSHIMSAHHPIKISAIFHQGACATTTEWNGRYMMRNNYEYSKTLFHYCQRHDIPFIYASSAAVYGADTQFLESQTHQRPLNVYGYSKWLFDQYVLQNLPRTGQAPVVGLRYFNVYGPGEQHKGSMASVAFHFINQLRDSNTIQLFEGSHGCAAGEQRRDFIFIDDVVKINLWFLAQPHVSGIFNVGTGHSESFNTLASTLINIHGSGAVKYVPFPDSLKAAYQSFTEADISKLRQAGYDGDFVSLESGLKRYYDIHY